MPVIFTKDKVWFDAHADKSRVRPGDTVLLPEDAVLAMLPQITEMKVEVRAEAAGGATKRTKGEKTKS